jgi:hypothetical protein
MCCAQNCLAINAANLTNAGKWRDVKCGTQFSALYEVG